MKHFKPSRFELELLECLWKLGPCSIREIQESLPAGDRPEYTTVQTIVYRLEQKGAVERVKKIGNAHVFKAVVSRRSAIGALIDDFLGAFGGSPNALASHLVDTGRLSLGDLKQLEKLARAPRSPDSG